MKYTNLILLSVLLLLFSCQNHQPTLKTGEILVNLDSLQKNKREYYSTYFDGGGIIVLETTDNSLLGRINKLCVSEACFFILDNSGVFVFRKDGTFLHNIAKCGNGPGEYNRLSDIAIDDKNNEVYLLDPAKHCVLVYDFDNNHKRTISLPDKGFCSKLIYHDGALYFSIIGSRGLDKNWLLCKMDLNNGNKITYYLDADEYNKGWYDLYYTDQQTFMQSSNGSPLLFQIFTEEIFKLNNDGPQPYVSIYSKSLPSKEFVSELNSENISNKLSGSGYIHSIYDFVENDMFLSFKFRIKNTTKVFFSNKRTATSFIVDVFSNDILYSDKNAAYIVSKMDAVDKDRVYCIDGKSIYSKELLLENLESGKINTSMVGFENLKNFLDDEEANPIIVYYNFKK